MRILHVSQPTTEGVAKVVSGLAEYQGRRGHSVAVACPTNGELIGSLRSVRIRTHCWEARRSPKSGLISETRRLRAIVAAERPDVIHLHSAKAGLIGRLAVRGKVPTVFQPHAWSWLAAAGLTRTLAIRWERFASRYWTSLILAISWDELAAGELVGIVAPHRVVPNGVDTSYFSPRPQSAARVAVGLTEGKVALCLGRLCEQKGQDLLVRFWPGVRKLFPDAQLVLVGDGPDVDALKAAAGAGVVFTGSVADPRDLLAAADVILAPSRWEAGLSLALMEAMSMGRPVAAFQVAGTTRDALEGAAFVVPPLDTAALVDALVSLFTNPETAASVGAAGRHLVSTRFDRSSSHEQLTYSCQLLLDQRMVGDGGNDSEIDRNHSGTRRF